MNLNLRALLLLGVQFLVAIIPTVSLAQPAQQTFSFVLELTTRYPASDSIIRGRARVGNLSTVQFNQYLQSGWHLSALIHSFSNGRNPVEVGDLSRVHRVALSTSDFAINLNTVPGFSPREPMHIMLALTYGNADPFRPMSSGGPTIVGFSQPQVVGQLAIPNQQNPGEFLATIATDMIEAKAFSTGEVVVPITELDAQQIADGIKTLVVTDSSGYALPTQVAPWTYRGTNARGQRLFKSVVLSFAAPMLRLGYQEFSVRKTDTVPSASIQFIETAEQAAFRNGGSIRIDFDGPRSMDRYTAHLLMAQAELIDSGPVTQRYRISGVVSPTGSNPTPAPLRTTGVAVVTYFSGSNVLDIDLMVVASNFAGSATHYFTNATARFSAPGLSMGGVDLRAITLPRRGTSQRVSTQFVGARTDNTLELFPRLAPGAHHQLRQGPHMINNILLSLNRASRISAVAESRAPSTFVTLNDGTVINRTFFASSEVYSAPDYASAGIAPSVAHDKARFLADDLSNPNDTAGLKTFSGFYGYFYGPEAGGNTGGGQITPHRPEQGYILNARQSRDGALTYGIEGLSLLARAVVLRQYCFSLFDPEGRAISHAYFAQNHPGQWNYGGWGGCAVHPNSWNSGYNPTRDIENDADYQAQVAAAVNIPYQTTVNRYTTSDTQHNYRFTSPLYQALVILPDYLLREVAISFGGLGMARTGQRLGQYAGYVSGSFESLQRDVVSSPGQSLGISRGLEGMIPSIRGALEFNRHADAAVLDRFRMFLEILALTQPANGLLYYNGPADPRDYDETQNRVLEDQALTEMSTTLGVPRTSVTRSRTRYVWQGSIAAGVLLQLAEVLSGEHSLALEVSALREVLNDDAIARHTESTNAGYRSDVPIWLDIASVRNAVTNTTVSVPQSLRYITSKILPTYALSYIAMHSRCVGLEFPQTESNIVSRGQPHGWWDITSDNILSETRSSQVRCAQLRNLRGN